MHRAAAQELNVRRAYVRHWGYFSWELIVRFRRANPVLLHTAPLDEYEPEVQTVLPRLPTCRSAQDVLTVLHEEFSAWFGPPVAPTRDALRTLSVQVWDAWQRYDATRP